MGASIPGTPGSPKGDRGIDIAVDMDIHLGDLVSRLSNGPYGASYGLLQWLMGDTKWTY